MHAFDAPHILTVGMSPRLVRNLWNRMAIKGHYRIAHLAHPTYDRDSWERELTGGEMHFFRDDIRNPIPRASRELLASLEQDGVPTIHNMIMSDRFVAKLSYEDAVDYAGLLTERLFRVYRMLQPAVIIGGFDSLHGSLGFAVARKIGIPWFALHFSSIPPGQVAFCSDLSPASRVVMDSRRPAQLRTEAAKLLAAFESRQVHAAAYIPPKLFSLSFIVGQIPAQLRALIGVWRRRRLRRYLRYTDHVNYYSLSGLLGEALRLRKNLWRLHRRPLLTGPVREPYAFFGLHVQPESSIDVFAHFFSNQERVVELMSRSLPPTHTLLVKLHKSDAPNYSLVQLERLSRYPGVRLVSPYADTYELIKGAALVFSIQGTIGLEGALLGKPVIMFGESPTRIFPSVSTVGKIPDLPRLIRDKLVERPPDRERILDVFATYLAPFYPASSNDWTISPTDEQIDDYVRLFEFLKLHPVPGRAGVGVS